MSDSAVTRAKHLMNYLVNVQLQEMIPQCDTIERVESWLEDDASREQYRKELVFAALRGLVRDRRLLVDYAGGLSWPDWADYRAQAEEALSAGRLPAIDLIPYQDMDIAFHYACHFLIEQYAYGDFVRPRAGDVFLDCGAYCGETAVWALSHQCSRVYAFEPNPATLPYLARNAARFASANEGVGEEGGIIPVPCGVGRMSSLKGLSGDPGNPGGSRLFDTANSENTVPVIALDDWCRENAVKPDFIKMDIEGSEVEAIQGAAQVIASCRPQLAICLYHRLSDMWTIPTMLKAIVPEYKFWCKKNHPVWEFVLYASV